MIFCPLCKNILNIENIANVNNLVCATCPYTYKINKDINRTTTMKTLAVEEVSGGDDEYKYASTCQKNCIKCDNDVALFMELQTRSADEPMTIFYQCTECKTNWKEN